MNIRSTHSTIHEPRREVVCKQSSKKVEMENIVRKINKKLPCREKIVTELYELVGDPCDSFPNAIYMFGHTGTGKSTILKKFFNRAGSKYMIVNCIECYTSKILYETIINRIQSHVLRKEDNFAPYAKCDNLKEFLAELRKFSNEFSYIVCLDNAERLREMDFNILPAFLKLQELTGLNICSILVSQLPFEKYFAKTGLSEVIVIHCPQYTKNEIEIILSQDFVNVKQYVKSKLVSKALNEISDLYEEKNEILESLGRDFYENYLSAFLNVFYRACRDLPELRMISRDCFEIYCEPVFNKSVDRNDVSKLWRNISKPLRTALSTVYMRIDQSLEVITEETFESNHSVKKLVKTLELPYYAKFLLIAAYLASYNAPKDDKRLFVKHHGKQRKRMKSVNANAKLTEKMSTSLGPKSFTVDRLLAIFYSILDEKVGLTCNLLAQISSLVHLKFLTFVSGENNIMEGSARLQCTISLEFILHIGKVVGFNVQQYLTDFMH